MELIIHVQVENNIVFNLRRKAQNCQSILLSAFRTTSGQENFSTPFKQGEMPIIQK